MPTPYHPKIQRATVRKAMQNMLQTKTGSKIGDKTFEKFLRANPKLRDLTHSGSMKKYEAEKQFKDFVEHVKSDPRIKIKMKAAERLLHHGEATKLGAQKFYGDISKEEISATTAQGPTPEQQRAAARRAERLKGYHRYSTLRDRMKGEQYSVDSSSHPKTSISELNEPHAPEKGKSEEKKPASYRPPAISAGAPRIMRPSSDVPAIDDAGIPVSPKTDELSEPAHQKAAKDIFDEDADAPKSDPDDMEIG